MNHLFSTGTSVLATTICKITLLILISVSSLAANTNNVLKPKQLAVMTNLVGQLFITGFSGKKLSNNIELKELLSKYKVGGLLFRKQLNVTNKSELQEFTHELNVYNQELSLPPLFLCADEEGGRVHLLREEYGFSVTNLSAAEIGKMKGKFAKQHYEHLASVFQESGLNFNFAPCVDLNINTNNPIIGKIERSYSEDLSRVNKYAKIFIKAFEKEKLLTCIKHYPGHGSSGKDSHKGIVDITETLSFHEALSFKLLACTAPTLMMGHLIDRDVDTLPASLSQKHVRNLRWKIGYWGLIITDDFEMRGVTELGSAKENAVRAIKAGNDMIIVGNAEQTRESIEGIYEALLSGALPFRKLERAHNRILRVKKRYLKIAIKEAPVKKTEAMAEVSPLR